MFSPTKAFRPIFIERNDGSREGSKYYGQMGIYAAVFYKDVYYISDYSHGEIYKYLGELYGDYVDTEAGYFHSPRSLLRHKYESTFGWEGYYG